MSCEKPTPFNIALGNALRLKRIKAGLSQEALAPQLDVTFQQVQKRESGKNRISAEDLDRTATILGTTAQVLVDEAKAAIAHAAGDSATASQGQNPLDQMNDRVRLEIVRHIAALTPKGQQSALRLIKTLREELAA